MILSQEDRELFYLLYDSITLYANDRLKVTDHMFYGDPQMVDEYEQTKVAMELWKAPSLVDEYVASEESESLMPDELAQLRDWERVLEGTFAVSVQPDGRALFLSDGYAFEVVGIAREIGELLGHGPSFVSAALVPFAGKIVYGGYLNQVSTDLGDRTDAFLTMQVQSAASSGAVISRSEDFIRASRSIAEARMQREVDSMLDDLDALGDDTSVQGTHRGALAGLSDDERAAAVREHAHGLSADESALLDQALRDAFLAERPFDDLRGLLLTQSKDELEWLARAWRLTGFSSLSKAQLADRLVGVMQVDVATMKRYLFHASKDQVKTLHAVSDAGGRLEVDFGSTPEERLSAVTSLPLFFEPVSYVFSYGGKLTAVIARELREVVAGLDWDALQADASRRQGIVDFAGSLAELRGIVEMPEAYDEYVRVLEDSETGFDTFKEVLEGQASGGRQGYEILESGDVYYIVFYDLADEYADAMRRMGGFRESLGDRAYLHGPLSPLLDGIIESRRGKVARPMDRELARADGVLDWELSQPPVAAMRRFFDANVPDGADDYRFADEVVDGIATMAHGGYGPQEYVSALQDRGFDIDKEHAKRFMQLAQNMIAAVPNWFNNGWSQVEMHEMATGLKVFYNEDGSPMRVGGNDPCPCGSKKKYKECHGRPRA